jgi:peptide deformylase
MSLEVVVYPDPRLLKKTAPIAAVTDEVRANAAEMLRLMYADHGVGLAAPQVGWSARLFVMNPSGDSGQPEHERVLVNPKIVKKAGRVRGEEGCLSFPGIYIEVERAKQIVVQWTDLEGKAHEESWADWEARIFQHELDHLDNVLLVHRMSETDRMQHASALDELRRKFQEA